MWQSLVVIGQAACEIRRRKKMKKEKKKETPSAFYKADVACYHCRVAW